MSKREWEIFGEEVCRNVQEAVEARDFTRLSQTITDTVNGAADCFSRGIRDMGDRMDRNRRAQWEQRTYQDRPKDRGYTYGGWGQEQRRGTGPGPDEQQIARLQRENMLYVKRPKGRVSGVLLTLAGGVGVGTLLTVQIFTLIAGSLEGGLSPLMFVPGVFAFLLGLLAWAGIKRMGRIDRFRFYLRRLAGKEYCNIKELAGAAGKSPQFIVRDLEKMIRRGWFRQGHLDEQKTCLITSDDMYRQYTEMMDQARKVKEEEKKAEQRAGEKRKELPVEVQEMIQAGAEYIRRIHMCNDAIPGPEISAKISRMETLTDRIFDRVEKNPEVVSDLHRLMEYYLPTTVKLLEAYQELDAQPIQGENILSSKREIEKTLDTLNIAFEKLLDGLFQDTAWDVSSDISVLHTMLAQEGLTEDAISKRREK